LHTIDIAGDVYDEGLEKTPWGRLVCFGANGPGEVLVNGRKTVGVAQRRTRDGARFQCIVYDRWDPRDVVDHLVLDQADRDRIAADLAGVAGGVGDRLGDLRDAIVQELLAD
jgi:lipoate-protein ligase A